MDTRSLRRLLPLLILTLAILTARAISTARLTRADPAAGWRRSVAHGFPPRPGMARFNATLSAGIGPAADSLIDRTYAWLPGHFRNMLGTLHEAESRGQAERAAALHFLVARMESLYVARFRQETLTRIRSSFDRLSPADRTRWVRLDRTLQYADTLEEHSLWGECDSLSGMTAEGFEALGDDFGAGRAWNRAGDAAMNRGDLARGAEDCERGLARLAACAAPFELGRTAHNLASAYEVLGQYDRAEQTLTRLYPVLPEIPERFRDFIGSDARSLEARLRLDRGRYPEALELYAEARRSSRQLAGPAGEAEDLCNLSRAHALVGQLDLALAEIDTALALSQRDHYSKTPGDCLSDRGDLLLQMGRPLEARAAYRLAFDTFRALGDPLSMAGALSGEGRVNGLRGDYAAGRAALERALALARRHGDARHEGEYLIGLGQLSLDCARYGPAHADFSAALNQADAIGLPDQQLAALLALGRIEQILGRLPEAGKHYARALELARSTERRGVEISTRLRQADLALALNQPEAAEREARVAGEAALRAGAQGLRLEALALEARCQLEQGQLDEAGHTLAAARRHAGLADHPLVAFDLQWTRARAARRAGRLTEAEEAYRLTTTQLDDLTDRASMAELRAGLLTTRYAAYRESVTLRLARGDRKGAFELADHARGRSLVESLDAFGATSALAASRDTTGANLRREIRTLTEALAREEAGRASAPVMEALRRRSAAARRALESRLAWRDPGARADSRRTRSPDPGLSELQARLSPGVAFVEFFAGESAWQAFVVRSDSLVVVTLPNLERGDTLSGRVNAFRDALELDYLNPAAPRDWVTPGAALYDDLWRPLAATLRGTRLVYVAAEGALRALPFSALVVSTGSGGRRAGLLLESCALAQVPSAATLLRVSQRSRSRASLVGGWLGVAATRPGRPISDSAVEREVHEAAAALAWPGSHQLVGRQATEENVARQAPLARWIHFACHARFFREAPRQSWLELTPTRANDGRLEVEEIERLRLSARLVTLSACETAAEGGADAGQATGEELVGMARAFMTAGADAVVASLWPVPDDAVGALMRAFYEELAQEPSQPALALNRAETGLLASSSVDRRRGHPYLTTAFNLTGAGD